MSEGCQNIYMIFSLPDSLNSKNKARFTVTQASLASACGRLFAGLAIFSLAFSAAAQDYPNRPIKLVIPSEVRSAGDQFARLLALTLTERLKQKVSFENIDGQDGTIAANMVAKAPADGYTLLFGNELTQVTNPLRGKSSPYNPAQDFTPIAFFSEDRYVLIAHPEVPASNVAELIEYAKKSSTRLVFGNYGTSTTSNMAGAAFQAMTGTSMASQNFDMLFPALNALGENQIQLMFVPARAAKQQLEGKRMKALGVAGPRIAGLPNVPPFGDAVPGFEITGWFAVFAPAKLPPEIQKFLNTEINAAILDTRLKTIFERMAGTTAKPGTPEELAAMIVQDTARREKLIKAAGMQQ